jgi:hypothetical protein
MRPSSDQIRWPSYSQVVVVFVCRVRERDRKQCRLSAGNLGQDGECEEGEGEVGVPGIGSSSRSVLRGTVG